MNLNHIIQQYKKLQTLEEYFNYKFDPRIKRKLKRKAKNAEMIIKKPEFEENEDEPYPVNEQIKNKNVNQVNTLEAMGNNEVPSKKTLRNSAIRKRNAAYIAENNNSYVTNIFNQLSSLKTPISKGGTSSYFFQRSNNYTNNDVDVDIKRSTTCRLCQSYGRESKNIFSDKEKIIEQVSKKFGKRLQYSVNNFPNIELGTFGQISSTEGIKVNYDINRNSREEFCEFNERIIPLKVKKNFAMEPNLIEKYKVKEIPRKEFNAKPFYSIVKPFVPALRARIHSNMKMRKKSPFKIVYSQSDEQIGIIDDKTKHIDFCIKGNEMY